MAEMGVNIGGKMASLGCSISQMLAALKKITKS